MNPEVGKEEGASKSGAATPALSQADDVNVVYVRLFSVLRNLSLTLPADRFSARPREGIPLHVAFL